MLEGLLAKLAWDNIKGPLLKVAPWIALAAALLIGWHVTAVHYRSEGRAEMQAKADGYRDQRDSWKGAFHQSDANFRAMAGIANAEKASIMALKRDGEDRARQAKANIAESIKRNAALTEQNKALLHSAGRHYSDKEPCTSSGAYMSAKDL